VPYVCTGCGADDDEHDPPCGECGSDSFVRVVEASRGGTGRDGAVRWRCRSCGRLHRRDRFACENCAATELGRVEVAPVADGEADDAGSSPLLDPTGTTAAAVRLAALGAMGLGALLLVDGRPGAGTVLVLGGALATPTVRRAVRRRLGVGPSDAGAGLVTVLALAVTLGGGAL
jgi:hypothetical protein